VGYYQNSYTSPTNNKMVIAKWNYDDLTDNGDDTFAPAFLEKFYIPFFSTLQGPTFYNGKLFIMSSIASLTEANTKIYVVDAVGKRLTNILKDFPTVIKNIETEGIYFYEENDSVVAYINREPFYKIIFN
jgi:hypothetical protein